MVRYDAATGPAGLGELPVTRFYAIQDRTFWACGMPWIAKLTKGVVREEECARLLQRGYIPGRWRRLCAFGLRTWYTMARPDRLWSQAGLFVTSGRFVKALREKGVRLELGGRVWTDDRLPKRLSLADAPDYHWVDGDRHGSAAMDFGASGYVGVELSAACDWWWYDVKESRPGDFPVVFDYDATSGLDLFTTDRSPEAFYCTERVLECAGEHLLTNVAFRPIEEGCTTNPW